MKRIFSIALAVLLAGVMFMGCGNASAPATSKSDGKISIVTTSFSPYDFARAIVGDKADISMLLPVGAEAHSFEPTPQDVLRIQNCDVFVYVGGESDDWVDGILDGIDNPKMNFVTLMDCVDIVEEEIVEGMEDEEEEEGEEPADGDEEEVEYDEHVWTSPRNVRLIVQKISDTVQLIDPANAETYKQNTTDYLAKLDTLDQTFQDLVAGAVRKTIVIGDRFPFRYFADAYGLTYYAAFPGCSTETEASPATVKFLIDKIKADQIPVVFHIQLSNEKMANTISEATGAKVLLLHSCEGVSSKDYESGKTYIDIMTENVYALREALY
ncbi:MAG: metal ABC transporter substrate-binding protein [Clostridiales bacterium]|nr:metal ABC transporter substrate-binding protein [Clostridiales bacterium]